MSEVRYLYIDDENDESINSLINGFNDLKEIYVERMPITRGLSFSDLKDSIISKIKSNEFQGLLIDLRLDGTGPEHLEYSAISVSSELRSIAARKEVPSFPIVLCSTIDKIRETYNADKTSQDLFDYTFKKSEDPNYPKFSRKLLSLAKGYEYLNIGDENLETIFNRNDLKSLDSRIFERFLDQETVPYDFAHFTIKTLFHCTNPLIKETILASRLGINIQESKKSWIELRDSIFIAAKYQGIFYNGWDRWWSDEIIRIFRDVTNEKLSFLNADERVNLLTKKTGIEGLVAAKPIRHNVSSEFWTICEAYKKPLDPLEGFRIQTSMALKPWQEPKYLSLDAILEQVGVDKSLKPHYSEKERIEELKKKLK
ncbi:hypothetical protein [Peijinzhouia sedimentorum]